jgi:hypothetical protein
MKTYDEIKKIITEHFKITSLEVYKDWLAAWRAKTWIPTEEDLKLLHPDVINSEDFWKVCEDLFSTDCVANAVDNGTTVAYNHMSGNRMNLRIARSVGLINWIDEFRHYNLSLLELGPGYGSLRNYVEATTMFNYVGFDVVPKTPDVKKCTSEGHIPPEYVSENAGKFNIVFSSNVLQHLSPKQRLKFFDDAYTLLSEEGMLMFNIQTDVKLPIERRYMTLYGQFIEIPTYEEIIGIVQEKYLIESTNGRNDGYIGLVCKKRKLNA